MTQEVVFCGRGCKPAQKAMREKGSHFAAVADVVYQQVAMNSTDLRLEQRSDSDSTKTEVSKSTEQACGEVTLQDKQASELGKISDCLNTETGANVVSHADVASAGTLEDRNINSEEAIVNEPANTACSENNNPEEVSTGVQDSSVPESTTSANNHTELNNATSSDADQVGDKDGAQLKSNDDDPVTTTATANVDLTQEGSVAGNEQASPEVTNSNSAVSQNGQANEIPDVHKCALCKTEFLSLPDFVEHKYHAHKQRMTFSVCQENPLIILPHLAPIDQANKDAVKTEQVVVEVNPDKKDKQNCESRTSLHYTGLSCDECGRVFRHKAALNKHRQVNHKVYTCEDCKITVKSAWELKKHVRSHTTDRPYACDICHKAFKKEAVLQTHLRVHSNIRDFQCKECGDSFKTKGSLDRHIRRHTDERPFVCKQCGRGFRESGALSRHHKAPTACQPRKGIQVSVTTTNKDGSTTSTVTHSIGTRSQTKAREAKNDLCKTEAFSGESDSTHKNDQTDVEQNVIQAAADASGTTTHAGENSTTIVAMEQEETGRFLSYQCRACGVLLDSNDTLREHLKGHIDDMPHRCGLCVFATSSRRILQEHMMTDHRKQLDTSSTNASGDWANTSEEQTEEENGAKSPDGTESKKWTPEQLAVFKVAYKQFLELQASGQSPEPVTSGVHGYKEMHRCDICNKSFRGKSYLRSHMRKHTGEKPFECTYCPKRFRCKDFLNKHILTHTNERRYKCGECGKLYKRITHVKEHLRIHSQERPFICQHCNKGFKTKTILQTHLKIHTDEAPWKCSYCQKAFREKASVIRHERSHTGEKPFACDRCGRAFAEHGTLARHKRAKLPCQPTNKPVVIDSEAPKHIVMPSTDESTAAASVLAEFSSVVANTQEYIVNIVETNDRQGGASSDVEDVIQTVILTENMLAEQQQMAEQQQQQQQQRQQLVEEQQGRQMVEQQQEETVEQQEEKMEEHQGEQEQGEADTEHRQHEDSELQHTDNQHGEDQHGHHQEIEIENQLEVPMETEECIQEIPHPVSVTQDGVNEVMVAMKSTNENEVSIVTTGTPENPELETVVIEM